MKFVFLIYVSRSGSTFLSRLVSENEFALVLPEFRTIKILARRRRPDNAYFTKEMGCLGVLDYQLAGLGFDAQDAERINFASGRSGLRGSLEEFVRVYLKNSEVLPSKVLVQYGTTAGIEALANAIPDAKFIHLVRNPFAVVASAQKTRSPYFPKLRFARGDTRFAAKEWVQHSLKCNDLSETLSSRWYTLKYEDVVSNPTNALRDVAAFIGKDRKQLGKAFRNFRVNDRENDIHTNVYSAPKKDRIDAWKRELCYAEKQTDASRVRGVEELFGYHESERFPDSGIGAQLKDILKEAAANVKHYFWLLWYHVKQPKRLACVLKERFARITVR